ncbi:MAG: V-type ATP synthase subunit E [archaeon]|nr:V-type ATP synthase subunit E [archaeon]
MSLEDLRKKLIQEGKTQANKITSAAQKEAETTVASAQEEAKKIIAQSKEKAKKIAESERSERIGASQLRAKKIVSEAKNRLVEENLEKAWEELKKMPKSPGYEKFLKQLIIEAEKELSTSAKTMVQVNKEDLKIAKKHSKNVSATPAQMHGGAIISTKDGKITIDNSLEAIFEHKKEGLRGIAFKALFTENGTK